MIKGLRDFYSDDKTGQRLGMRNNGSSKYRTDIPIGSVSKKPIENFRIVHSGSEQVFRAIPTELKNITSYKNGREINFDTLRTFQIIAEASELNSKNNPRSFNQATKILNKVLKRDEGLFYFKKITVIL